MLQGVISLQEPSAYALTAWINSELLLAPWRPTKEALSPEASQELYLNELVRPVTRHSPGHPPPPPGDGHGSPAPPPVGWVGWPWVGVIDR